MRVVYIGERIQHHAGRSGYDQFARRVRSRPLSPAIHHALTSILERTPSSAVKARLDSPPYSWYWRPEQLAQELHAMGSMALAGGVYHWLYGENDFRWAGRFPRRKGAKIVVSMHQPPQIFERVFPDPKALRQADAVLACCRSQGDYLKNLAGEDKVHVIPHGVDADFFTPAPKPAEEKFIVLAVGSWLRDFSLLMEVIREADRRQSGLCFHLVPPQDRIKDFDGAPNTKIFYGVPDAQLLSLYQSASVLFMPVTDFTASNTLLEGMACGLPAVATDVGGMGDYMDSSCGVLVPPSDPEQALTALLNLKENQNLAPAMAESARKRALEFDWKKIAQSVMKVYRGLYAR
ncbi:glycosyltransferase family 4 protein [Desulfatibacillum aliphaticivorans]|uniref:glycosyltransferase family 4 protein n=1 Tax=Desulfatibacillum aliphaticivorans TaxID=218208 RepID=UPI000413862C|nr:glycosyltransferase family 4 protein [Desulfatibacillum aliphaticivorans]